MQNCAHCVFNIQHNCFLRIQYNCVFNIIAFPRAVVVAQQQQFLQHDLRVGYAKSCLGYATLQLRDSHVASNKSD